MLVLTKTIIAVMMITVLITVMIVGNYMGKAFDFSDKLDVEKCFQHNAGYKSVS